MLQAPARVGVRDHDIGIQGFVTTTPALGGRLKVRIDDFRVDEIGPNPPQDSTGRFSAARIRLTNWETHRFVQEASHALAISRKKVHFSGTKDKRGVTVQWFTFESPVDKVRELSRLAGVEVLEAHLTSSERSLGDHQANQFRIVVRDVEGPRDHLEGLVEATWAQLARAGGCPNFFGPQRFGTRRANTHKVGERMIRGDFEGAVLAYLTEPAPGEPAELAAARADLRGTRDWKAAIPKMNGDLAFERALLHRLVETEGDAVAALQALPETLQWLFLYAWQSYLFNRILSERIRAGLPLSRAVVGDLVAGFEQGALEDEWIPVREQNLERVNEALRRHRAVVTGMLPGTEVPFAQGPMGDIERGVLREENVDPRDFLVPEHLPWSSKGTRRALLASIHDFAWQCEPDDLHAGRWKLVTEFRLAKGTYATTVLREFLKSPWQEDYA